MLPQYRSVFFCITLALMLAGLFFFSSPAHAAFSLTAVPSSGTVDQGNQISFVATVTLTSGSEAPVGFNVLDLPAGATATFSTGSCTPTCSIFVTINTGAAGPVTNRVLTVEAANTAAVSTTYTLAITDPSAPAKVSRSLTQTDDTAGTTGFNFTGNSKSNTTVSGTGNGASVKLSGAGLSNISGGFLNNCAVSDAGNAYCWGNNNNGQAGDNTVAQRNTPVQVHGVGDVGFLTGVAQISTGASPAGSGNYSCAVKTDGTAYCWGYNGNGQLGDNTTTQRTTPVQVLGVGGSGFLTGVAQISTSQSGTTCAVKTDGTAYCWGSNNFGKLGDNTTTQRTTPVQVHGVGDVGFLTGVAQVSAGSSYSTCAVKTDGTAYCWGLNNGGALGDNTTTQRTTPVQVHGVGDVGFLTGVAQISAGTEYNAGAACAVKTDGTAYCWGDNTSGMLGDGTTTQRLTPVQVVGVGGTGTLTNVVQISVSANRTACAVKTDGTAYCWGYNDYGQVGDNTLTARSTPVQVLGVGGTGTLSNIAQVTAGSSASCALANDGSEYCWGRNTQGQIGDNTTTNSKVPVQTHGVGNVGTLDLVATPTLSGTYTSGVLDSGQTSDFTTVEWNATTPASTGVTMEMRTGANPTVDGTWTGWGAVSSGADTGATFDGKRYAQYRATLTTSNVAVTPSLNDITINYLVPDTFNFTAAVTPQPGSVMKGGSLTPSITASLTYGADAPNPVTFSIDPATLPAGVSPPIFFNSPCSPTLSTATPTCTSEFTITTTGATPLGDYVIPIKASIVVDAQNTITKEATYAFTVTEPFDFSLNWAGASSGTVTQGGNTLANFAVAKTAGSTSEAVTFSYSPSVQGVSVSFSPYTSCAPSATCPGTLTADIRTTFTGGAGDTPSGGPYTVTITAATATLSKSIQFNLSVTPGFNFSMGLDNLSDSIYAGDATAQLTTLTTTYVSGSSGTVSYAITNPDPAIITVTPSTLGDHSFGTVGETFSHPQLNISVSPSFIPVAQTTYSIIIAGTSGTGLTRYATYVLTIYPPFDFTMQFSSPATANFDAAATPQDSDSGTAYQGEMVSQVISLTFNSPLPQVVDLTSAISIVGSNISASPSPSQCTSQYCTVMLPIITSGTTPENTYAITITGTGGGQTHTVTYALNVLIPPFDYNMRGWAFSDGIGWISFNSRNCDIDWDGVMDRTNVGSGEGDNAADAQCPADNTPIPNYGTHLDASSYELSGLAWSEHIGWITFEKAYAGTPPQAPYNNGAQSYIALLESGTIKGWARAISCPGTECDTNSEWGWIKMSGTATDGSPYGVGNATSDLTGFAWGGHALGWISFNSQNCDTDNNGIWDACGLSGTAYPYKVSVLSTLPNAPPECINLESNFLNRCTSPFTPSFSCMYKDNEGDPLAMFIINIYDASTDALVDGPIYVPGPTIADTFPLTQYDPLPNVAIPVTYSYSGTALQYGNTYYFTVEVRDEAHLN